MSKKKLNKLITSQTNSPEPHIQEEEPGVKVYSGNPVQNDSADSERFAGFAPSVSQGTGLIDTPYFDDEIFKVLPGLYDFIINIAEDKRERDVMFFGFNGLLSGIFPKVSGMHTGKLVRSNLYHGVYAPAGSGKGKLGIPYQIGYVIHELLAKECYTLKQSHRQECAACRKGGDCTGNPPKPICKSLYIKGDISTSALKDYLFAGECNVIFETESYVLSKNKGKEWADSEDVFLNAWEHESIGKARVNDENDVEIKEPKLSIVVSGTPSMLDELIPSVLSGFFSRTCFYVFSQELKWKDQFSDKQAQTLTHIEKAKKELLEIFKFNWKHPVRINLSETQRVKHKDLYSAWTEELKHSEMDPEYFALIARSGRVLFKIAMIMSAIRRYQEKNTNTEFTCNDLDFEIAKSICGVLHEHSKRVFKFLSKVGSRAVDDKFRLFNSLPREFLRKDAIELGKSMNFSERTIDEWLKEGKLEGKLIRSRQGNYRFAKASESSEPANE